MASSEEDNNKEYSSLLTDFVTLYTCMSICHKE